MEGSNSVKSIEMGLITFVTQAGVGIVVLPTTLTKEAGHDGWIVVLITGIIVITFCLLILTLLRRYSDKNIYDINKLIYGKIIGTGFNTLLVLYLFTGTVAGASLFSYFIRITLLQETPRWALAPFITLPSFYLVWQGLKSVSRFLFCSLLSFITILLFLILLYGDMRFSFLMPVGEAGIMDILSSTKTCFYAFLGFELTAFFYPYVSDRNKMLKWQIIAISGSTIFFAIIVAVSTSLFGENLLTIFSMPFFNISRIYNAPILERVDLYLIALWFIPMACSMRSYIIAAFEGIQKVFRIKRTKLVYSIFFLVILLLASIPNDINHVFLLINIINNIGLGVTLFLVICLFLSFIRKKGVNVK